jgi:hypothetical protein
MQSPALPIDRIFQPPRWQPARWLAEWLRHWAASQLERREALRKRVAIVAAPARYPSELAFGDVKMIDLTDDDLNRMRKDTESNFVERKTVKNKGGWLRTAVAFANSAPVDYPAVLFVGVNDDGTLENVPPDHDWESQQKTVTAELSRAYPPLYYLPKMLRDQGREFLAVIIPGSRERPHFTGKAYIRVGPETIEASDEQFENLIAQRSSKIYEILKWKGKTVTVENMVRFARPGTDPSQGSWYGIVEDCNQFWVSLSVAGSTPKNSRALPLNQLDLSFDMQNERLRLLHWQT